MMTLCTVMMTTITMMAFLMRIVINDDDLQGHLSGKLERHFTHDACPTFHNTTAKVDITTGRIMIWMVQNYFDRAGLS